MILKSLNFWCFIIVLLLPFLISKIKQGKVDLLSPPVLLSIVCILGYLVPLPSFIAGIDLLSIIWPYRFDNLFSAAEKALGLTAAGVFAANVGYWLGRYRNASGQSSIRIYVPKKLLLSGLFACLWGLGSLILTVLIVGGMTQYILGLSDRVRMFQGLNYIMMGLHFPLCFAFVWWLRLLEQRHPWNIRFLVFLLFAFGLSALGGNRSSTFPIVVAGVAAYHRLYRAVSLGKFVLWSTFGSMFLVGTSIVVREYLVSGSFHTVDSSLQSWLFAWHYGMSGDFYQLQALAILADNIPHNMPYEYGSTYFYFFIALIPYSLWPGKANFETAAGFFAKAFWYDHWFYTGTTIPPSLIGEMFLNFGPIGIVLGMFIFGLIYKIFSRLPSRGITASSICHFFMLGAMVSYIRGEFSSATVTLLTLLFPTLFFWQLSTTRYRYLITSRVSSTHIVTAAEPQMVQS
jgi:oligosaccharide repeat unit polymerase